LFRYITYRPGDGIVTKDGFSCKGRGVTSSGITISINPSFAGTYMSAVPLNLITSDILRKARRAMINRAIPRIMLLNVGGFGRPDIGKFSQEGTQLNNSL